MKKSSKNHIITNQRSYFDYTIMQEYVAGVVLTGAETKSLRFNRGSLKGSYVTIYDGEAWLNNAQIMPTNTNSAHLNESSQTRARKLLLRQKELLELARAKEQGYAIVAIKILTTGRYIKVVIATAKGKKLHDKRHTLKARAELRDAQRAVGKYKS